MFSNSALPNIQNISLDYHSGIPRYPPKYPQRLPQYITMISSRYPPGRSNPNGTPKKRQNCRHNQNKSKLHKIDKTSHEHIYNHRGLDAAHHIPNLSPPPQPNLVTTAWSPLSHQRVGLLLSSLTWRPTPSPPSFDCLIGC